MFIFDAHLDLAFNAVAMSHLHYYRAMERHGWVRSIRTRGDKTETVTVSLPE